MLAGSGTAGSANGTGASASFNSPRRLAIDATGNLYVTDAGNNLIRKITPAGVVTTVAGSGKQGRNDGPALAATFNGSMGIAADSFGNLYVVDSGDDLIRKISASGIVTTLAGTGQYASQDGTGTAAGFGNPNGIAVDGAGNLYVADTYNTAIRKITPAGVVTTVAGTFNVAGNANGTGTAATFSNPYDLTLDAAGNIYVCRWRQRYDPQDNTCRGCIHSCGGHGWCNRRHRCTSQLLIA